MQNENLKLKFTVMTNELVHSFEVLGITVKKAGKIIQKLDKSTVMIGPIQEEDCMLKLNYENIDEVIAYLKDELSLEKDAADLAQITHNQCLIVLLDKFCIERKKVDVYKRALVKAKKEIETTCVVSKSMDLLVQKIFAGNNIIVTEAKIEQDGVCSCELGPAKEAQIIKRNDGSFEVMYEFFGGHKLTVSTISQYHQQFVNAKNSGGIF